MTNNLLADWHLRVKFVDDTSAIEILLRNSISLLNSIVSDIHKFSMDHNMRLNSIKCNEMLINLSLINLSIETLGGIIMLTTYIKKLARSFTLNVFYAEPALTKLAC